MFVLPYCLEVKCNGYLMPVRSEKAIPMQPRTRREQKWCVRFPSGCDRRQATEVARQRALPLLAMWHAFVPYKDHVAH